MSFLSKYNNAVHLYPVLRTLPISCRHILSVVGGLQCFILVIPLAFRPIPSATVTNTKSNVGFVTGNNHIFFQ